MVQMKKHRVLLKQRVFFGDCDPAGIVFYPNIFSWFDRAFHMLLDPLGGHAAVCKRLDALGMGVMDAKAQFRRPLRSGDEIQISLRVLEWGSKSVTLAYEVKKEDVFCVSGVEVRVQADRPGYDRGRHCSAERGARSL